MMSSWVSRLLFGISTLTGALFCGRPFLTRLPPFTLFVCNSRSYVWFLTFVHLVCHIHFLLFLFGLSSHLFLLVFFMLAVVVKPLV